MTSRYLVLVDSSIWINFFRFGNQPMLESLIRDDLVCTNDLVLTELIPTIKAFEEKEAINGLLAIPKLELQIDWELIRKYQLMNIQRGVNKVGIPDLIILQQVVDQKITLFSQDKHFKLMSDFIAFDLLQ